MIEFTVPGDLVGDLSPNLRLHYYERHRRAQDWKGRAFLAWRDARVGRVEGKARIQFVVRRGRVVDPDNALASCKALIDGLKDEPGRPALLPGDSARDVEYAPVRFETGARWKARPEVVVLVGGEGDGCLPAR